MKLAVMAQSSLLAVIVLCLLSVTQGSNLYCSEPCLIYSATNEINAIELSTSRKVNLVANLQRAVALDVHVSKKTVYWSDINLHVIKRMNMSSGIVEDIITDDLGSVEGLAVEWESQLMYWSDYTYSKIEVASLDGSQRKLLFTEKVGNPRGIALYPKKGLMFWTDWGLTPKIERASLAGDNRTVLVYLSSSSQIWPMAIFVDFTADRVYWIDAYVDVIDSTDLNGQNRRMLTSDVRPSINVLPFDFTVYGDTLYWSDWYSDTIEKLNWTTADYIGGHGILTSDRVFGLALLDQSRQPASAGNQLCKVNNGSCSHLCLLKPGGYMCACPDGLPLLPDGKSCLTDFTKFLLFSEGSNIRQLALHYNSTSSLRIPLKKPTSSSIIALDCNLKDNRVYWTDVFNDTISRAFLDGSSQETIVSTGLRSPYGLAVDPFGQNIYWTDSIEDVIEVASLNGAYRAVLIGEDLESARDIILDVTRGFMYWTDWGYYERIERANMDGTNRTVIIGSGIYYPNGLALDATKNWLYWIDFYYDKLEVYEFPSKTRRQIISAWSEPSLTSPLGVTLYEDYVYWTDRNLKGIYRADRETGGNAEKVLSTQSLPGLIRACDTSKIVIPVTDQCNNNKGGCSHLCIITANGKKCLCSDGFILQDDEKSCRKAPPKPFLLFADATYGRIMKVSEGDPNSLTSLPLGNVYISRPVALDYDPIEDRVYWTDVTRKTISRAFMNGSAQEVLFDVKVEIPDGLAVDVLGRNLYWTDTGTNKLEVSKLDGSFRTALVTRDLDEPRDIILDPFTGKMYWTDWGTNPKIEKAEMTGKQRVVIVSSGLRWPNGLTLDYNNNRLYWVDGSLSKLEYVDLNQNKRVTLISSFYNLPHPFGLTVLGDHVYWTDWWRYAVYRANKETGDDVTSFITGIGKPMDIHGFNLSEAKPGNSSCQFNNGGCSHICLLSSTGSECACPSHLNLMEDEKTCEHYVSQKFLLFAGGRQAEISLLHLEGSYSEVKNVPVGRNILLPVALDLDIKENRIYWSDVTLNTINRVYLNGSSPEIIVSENVYSPEGLAIDPLGRNIYWTDTGTNKIEVSRMDGTMRKSLISHDLDQPRDLILDYTGGLMYWSDWGKEHRIEVANMDGDNRRTLVKRGLYWPNGLTLDDTNNRIYWVDAFYHTLEYYDPKSDTITTLLQNSSILPHPFGLTFFEGGLYWTDWMLDSIYQAEKNTLSNPKVLIGGLSRPMDIHAYDLNKTLPDHPCSSSYGGCSHLCLLIPNGYSCSCPDHLKLSEDGKTCIPEKFDFPRFLLFCDANTAEILVLPLDGSSSVAKALTIGIDIYRPIALAMDIAEDRVYWTDISLNRISRMFINGSSPEVIVTGNIYSPEGLAIDPIGGIIYWTESVTNKIEASKMDGSMRKTLIDQDLDRPRDIIVDLNKRSLFWCDWGNLPKIEVAYMDGSNRRILVTRGLYWPNGLTKDDTNNRLYWVDAFLDVLEYYDFESGRIKTLLEDSSMLPHPFGLTLHGNYLYWTDWAKGAVYQAEKNTLSDIKTIFSGVSQPMDIHAYDRNQTLPDSPCSLSNGGCSHLCLQRPDGHRCSCPDFVPSGDVCSTSVVILPSSSTPINAPSTSASHTKTPSATFSSYHTFAASSPTSIFTPSSSTEQQATVSSSTPPSPTECRDVSGKVCSPSVVILPSSSTPIEAPSTSASHTKTPSATFSSYHTFAASSPTSIFTPSSSTEQQATVSSPTPPVPTECRNNTCKNGGTCVIPGYFCECRKYYVWNLCLVYVGSSAVQIEITLKKQWMGLNFELAIAKACTKFYCKGGECKSKSGRVKRSEKAQYFQVADVKILGLSSGGENTWKIELAVLFPSVDGKAPQPVPADELDRTVNENKASIEEAVGGAIKKTTIGKISEQPPTKRPEKTYQDKEKSSVPIAVGVVSVVVLIVIVLVAVVVYRIRRKRRTDDRKTNTLQLEDNMMSNSHTNIEFDNPAFDNPAFDNDSIYDSISKATGSSVAANLGQACEGGSNELGMRNVTTNKTLSDDSNRTHQALDEAGVSNPTYSMATAYSGDYRIENPETRRYASLQPKKEQQAKEYAGKDGDYYLMPVHSQSDIPQRTSDTATDEDIYENLKFEDASSA